MNFILQLKSITRKFLCGNTEPRTLLCIAGLIVLVRTRDRKLLFKLRTHAEYVLLTI